MTLILLTNPPWSCPLWFSSFSLSSFLPSLSYVMPRYFFSGPCIAGHWVSLSWHLLGSYLLLLQNVPVPTGSALDSSMHSLLPRLIHCWGATCHYRGLTFKSTSLVLTTHHHCSPVSWYWQDISTFSSRHLALGSLTSPISTWLLSTARSITSLPVGLLDSWTVISASACYLLRYHTSRNLGKDLLYTGERVRMKKANNISGSLGK